MTMCRDGSSTDSSSLNDGDEEEDELSSAIIRSRKINKKVRLFSVLCLFSFLSLRSSCFPFEDQDHMPIIFPLFKRSSCFLYYIYPFSFKVKLLP
jgi:hypothetical protein